jgi:hypothetical protein
MICADVLIWTCQKRKKEKIDKTAAKNHNIKNENVLPIKQIKKFLIWSENKCKKSLNKLNLWVSMFRVGR